ncbi:hypothetical protein VNO78_09359 [Psophocarpus tetragonolobus]|uniref:Uncharacterized protein n=1 Tax=Psophocarpus tetragonolobus TaxID=3891 RepID=A0AAN9XT61_PSOTE
MAVCLCIEHRGKSCFGNLGGCTRSGKSTFCKQVTHSSTQSSVRVCQVQHLLRRYLGVHGLYRGVENRCLEGKMKLWTAAMAMLMASNNEPKTKVAKNAMI